MESVTTKSNGKVPGNLKTVW